MTCDLCTCTSLSKEKGLSDTVDVQYGTEDSPFQKVSRSEI